MTDTMHAWLLRGPGDTSAFERIERPIPTPPSHWLVIKVDAFGLNRSELFSRKGLSSDDFSFPRVLGLECVGHVLDPGDTDLSRGQRVMALMGGMGRGFDGGYATHLLAPRRQVFPVDAPHTDDPSLGAIPETYNTAWGVCVENLKLRAEDHVLVRGGTSALGMEATDIAKHIGARVVTTTRNPAKAERLKERSQADVVVLDGEDFATRVLDVFGPVTAIVECVGSKATIASSCATMTQGGRLGLVGQLSETWATDAPPNIADNITRAFTRSDLVQSPNDDARMADIIQHVDAGHLRPNIHRVFSFAELPDAHRVMERNEAVGKLVVHVNTP